MKSAPGFTLIELSIVLVIIGLIVGGVLVGQDLIRGAEVRAQISQIEKYNTAVNTFRGKYNALPGDLNAATATTFGFAARGSAPGQGDGNGLIDGNYFGLGLGAAGNDNSANGEQAMLWVDLSSANGLNLNLIDGSFSTATPTTSPTSTLSGTQIGLYFPAAKIGRGNFVSIIEMGGVNYFELTVPTVVAGGVTLNFGTTIPVNQAYQMDKKIDDGLPQSGNVMSATSTQPNPSFQNTSDTNAESANASSCYDDGGSTSNPYKYTLSFNNGSGPNCALSFRFQ